MKNGKKIWLLIFFAIFICMAVINLRSLQPVTIIFSEHDEDGYSDIVVDHLPLTDSNRIQWYMNHKQELMKKYTHTVQGYYVIYIWEIGEGFMDPKINVHHDLICFDTLTVKKNCIDKNLLLVISHRDTRGEVFQTGYDSITWSLDRQGKKIANRDESLFFSVRSATNEELEKALSSEEHEIDKQADKNEQGILDSGIP